MYNFAAVLSDVHILRKIDSRICLYMTWAGEAMYQDTRRNLLMIDVGM